MFRPFSKCYQTVSAPITYMRYQFPCQVTLASLVVRMVRNSESHNTPEHAMRNVSSTEQSLIGTCYHHPPQHYLVLLHFLNQFTHIYHLINFKLFTTRPITSIITNLFLHGTDSYYLVQHVIIFLLLLLLLYKCCFYCCFYYLFLHACRSLGQRTSFTSLLPRINKVSVQFSTLECMKASKALK